MSEAKRLLKKYNEAIEYTFEETDSEGDWDYYEVYKDGKYIGDLAVNEKKKLVGKSPASNEHANLGDKELIKQLSDFIDIALKVAK